MFVLILNAMLNNVQCLVLYDITKLSTTLCAALKNQFLMINVHRRLAVIANTSGPIILFANDQTALSTALKEIILDTV